MTQQPQPRPSRPLQPSGAPPPLPGQRVPVGHSPASPPERRPTDLPHLSLAATGRLSHHTGVKRNNTGLPSRDRVTPELSSESGLPGPPRRTHDRHASVMAALSEARSNKEWNTRQSVAVGRGRAPSSSPLPDRSPKGKTKVPPPVVAPQVCPPAAKPAAAAVTSRVPSLSRDDHRKTAIAISRLPAALDDKQIPAPEVETAVQPNRLPPPNKPTATESGDTKSETASLARQNPKGAEADKSTKGGEPPAAPAPAALRSPTSPAPLPSASSSLPDKPAGLQIFFGSVEDRSGNQAYLPANLVPSLDLVRRERRKMVSLWQQQSALKKRRANRNAWLEAVSMKCCADLKSGATGTLDALQSLVASFPFTLRETETARQSTASSQITVAPAGNIVGGSMKAGRLFRDFPGTETSPETHTAAAVLVVSPDSMEDTFWSYVANPEDRDVTPEVLSPCVNVTSQMKEEVVMCPPIELESMVVDSPLLLPPPPPITIAPPASPSPLLAVSPPVPLSEIPVPPPPGDVVDAPLAASPVIPPPPPPPPPPGLLTDGVAPVGEAASLPAILPVPIPPPSLRLQSPAILPSPFSGGVLPPPNSLVAPPTISPTIPPPASPAPLTTPMSPPTRSVDSELNRRRVSVSAEDTPRNSRLVPSSDHMPCATVLSPSPPYSSPPSPTPPTPRIAKKRKPHGSSAVARLWPRNCRFVVLWGFETCALSHKATSASIEQLIEFLRSSAEFAYIFGAPKGLATVQGVGNIDRKAVPFPVRWTQMDLDRTPSGPSAGESASAKQSELVFRSLFSSRLFATTDGKRWQGSVTSASPMNSDSRISRPDQLLSALIEFQDSDQAAAFFFANAYSDVADCWGGRLWSIPDCKGIKFWLHAILSNTGTWCNACLPANVASSTLSTLPDEETASSSIVYAPFLTEADVASMDKSLEFEIARDPEASGYHLRTENLQWMQQRAAVPVNDSSGTSRVPPRLCLLVQSSLVDWAATHLGADPGYLPCWARIAKYVHRMWAENGVLPEAVSPVTTDKKAIPKKSHPVEDAKTKTEPPKIEAKKTENEGNAMPKHFVVRVALLVCSRREGDKILTPVLLCTLDDFLHCRFPLVQKMVTVKSSPTTVPSKKPDETTTSTTDAKTTMPANATRLKRKLPETVSSSTQNRPKTSRRVHSGTETEQLMDRLLTTSQPAVKTIVVDTDSGALNTRGGKRARSRHQPSQQQGAPKGKK